MKRGYKANITSNLINQATHLVLGLFTSILIARVLGPERHGYVTYILLFFTLMTSYGHLGLNNAVMYFHKRKNVDAQHLFNVNITCLLLIFAGLTVLTVGGWKLGLFLVDYPLPMIAGGLVFVLAGFFYYNNNAWFIASERIRESNRYNLTVFLLKTGTIFAFWLMGILVAGTNFWIAVVAMMMNALLLQIRLKRGLRLAWDAPLLKAEFRYGGILYLAAAFDHLHLRMDQLFIKGMLGLEHLGVYSMAVMISELMFLIPISINSALTGRLYNIEGEDAGRIVLARTLKLSFYVCMGLTLVGIPLALLIPYVYGIAFQGAVLPSMILLLGAAFASVARVSAPYFFTSGRPLVHLRITFFCLITNTLLNWIMIPIWGINGAAISSAISYFIYGFYYITILVKKEGFQLRNLFVLSLDDIRMILPQ